jgi:hypothetical protein
VTRNNISIDNVKGPLMKSIFQLLYVLRKVNILKHFIPKFSIKVKKKKPTPTAKNFNIGTKKLAPIGNLLKNNTINNNTSHCSKNNNSTTTFMRKNMISMRIYFVNQNNNNNLRSSTNTRSTNICKTNINNTNQITR